MNGNHKFLLAICAVAAVIVLVLLHVAGWAIGAAIIITAVGRVLKGGVKLHIDHHVTVQLKPPVQHPVMPAPVTRVQVVPAARQITARGGR